MEKYIFGEKEGIYIIDLEKTAKKLEEAKEFAKNTAQSGGKILFVATKRQFRQLLKEQAESCVMPYIIERWVGGFLTNFSIVIKLTKKYKNLVKKRDSGALSKYTKKEQLDFEREIKKLESAVFGVKDMEKIPDAIFIWDVKNEKTAVKEAQVKKIPIIGICDTNTNPKGIDYIIPTNDDASKTIEIVLTYIADCVIDAKKSSSANASEDKEAKNQEAAKLKK